MSYQHRGTARMSGSAIRNATAQKPSVSVIGECDQAVSAVACLEMLGFRVVLIERDMGIDRICHAIRTTDVTFVYAATAIGTDGRRDFTLLERAACAIGRAISDKRTFHAVVLRSPVPPGTGQGIVGPIVECVSGRHENIDFGVAVFADSGEEVTVPEDVFAMPISGVGAGCSQVATLIEKMVKPITKSFTVTSISAAERAAWN